LSIIGTLIVHVAPGAMGQVRSRLTTMAGAEIVGEADAQFAVLLESPTPRLQSQRHKEIAGWYGVHDTQVVFGARGDDS
jgi:nitrate reductase NapAB chaperone NapD